MGPEGGSSRISTNKGTLYPGGEFLPHLQPWPNRPARYQYSNKKGLHLLYPAFDRCPQLHHITLQMDRRNVLRLFLFAQQSSSPQLFKQFYLNGQVPHPGMGGYISMFACAQAHVLPSGCFRVVRGV